MIVGILVTFEKEHLRCENSVGQYRRLFDRFESVTRGTYHKRLECRRAERALMIHDITNIHAINFLD